MSIEAMKMALETLERLDGWLALRYGNELTPPEREVVTALRQAIEQAEQAQPFGYFRYDLRLDAWVQNRAGITGTPFYTTPPSRKPWVGLTGDEVNEFAAGCHLGNSVQGAIRKAEAKIKEKNT